MVWYKAIIFLVTYLILWERILKALIWLFFLTAEEIASFLTKLSCENDWSKEEVIHWWCLCLALPLLLSGWLDINPVCSDSNLFLFHLSVGQTLRLQAWSDRFFVLKGLDQAIYGLFGDSGCDSHTMLTSCRDSLTWPLAAEQKHFADWK